MQIDGPFRVTVVESQDTLGHELRLEFTEAFRALAVADQAGAMRRYLAELQRMILDEPQDSAERRGMLTIQQVAAELLPHIAAGEIPLGENIVIRIAPNSPMARFIPGDRTIN